MMTTWDCRLCKSESRTRSESRAKYWAFVKERSYSGQFVYSRSSTESYKRTDKRMWAFE